MVVIEVWTGETYGKLLDDKDMWINGKGVNVVMLIYGPLEYRDHKWVGELRETFIEVCRPDSHDRFDLIQDGFELVHECLPVTLTLNSYLSQLGNGSYENSCAK
ncbi:hypothetical protein POJ06DRAFT_304127 [Lipomyces tetrasporus]|uniref:Uncharacterized protein n=1 Tax=Lipomyces tetrasporus TaxID=54092 RepID=A0AAD7VPD4_9ASCO|nr:uncharacterized protein POJ06DRAFT_304127 [Lipomyces tetrasporus]KAJ8096596.1 hypothetical protein POJ06DRAFT_304127 [Lipomyces tetrasporus]